MAKMKKLKVLLLILVVLIASGFVFQKQLTTNLKIALFITEEFPQIPIKPLGMVSLRHFREKVELDSSNGKIVGDLFLPVASDKRPAVILAMGVKTSEDDKPLLWHFADSMARLGYVTFWPRLETLDIGQSLPEEPETFVESFKYLASLPQTDSARITFVGFSVGSSIALVAASDPQISERVHALVFFGGHYNVFDYLLSLTTNSTYLGGEIIAWQAHKDAINHAKDLLKAKGAVGILQIFEATNSAQANAVLNQAPENEIEGLKKYSPRQVIDQFKADIFILHDKSDTFVPYTESIKLKQAFPEHQIAAYHISDLFEHVQPNRPIKFEELFKLYGFLYKVFEFI